MRRSSQLLTVLLLLSALTGYLVAPPPTSALDERLVLSFYYAWFDSSTWQENLSDYPVQPYASRDSAAMERHVLQAQQAGIDAFVQSWYGPQVEGNQTETNFATLLDVAARHGFAVAVDLEVDSSFLHSEADVVAALQHLLTIHASHPAYLRVGGRPVIFFWRQDRYPVETWSAIREQVDPGRASIWIMEGVDLDYLGPFDGNHLYSVAWDPEPEGTLIRWGQRIRGWNAEHGAAKYWVGTVMPGYDDRVTGRADAFVQDRSDGAYYRRCWDGAIQSGADWVIITSFNEWMEGTQIEPSVTYGTFYLDLTREMGDLYRVSEPVPPGPPPTAVVDPTDIPLPTSTSTPASRSETPEATAVPSPTPPVPTPTPTPTVTVYSSPTATRTPTAIPPATASTSVPTATLGSPHRVVSGLRVYSGLIAGGAAAALMLLMFVRRRHR
ncbi:MAG: glycoside hydrolase family 99-like domain-containing protein [Anaerolineae bacterium]|jgi:hypothetical protein